MSTHTDNVTNESALSRRRFLAATGLVAAAGWLTPLRLYAQDASGGIVNLIRKEAATAKITVQSLRGNVSVLMGSGGNIGLLTGNDGKILVDAGITASRPRITAALARISPDPIKYLINTHWHFDHTDGNEWLHAAGATIFAHENTLKRLSTSQRVEGWNFTFPPSPAGALPTIILKADLSLQLNHTTLALKYYNPAHTDSDISVHFADVDILHVGDTWWNGYYPFIDYSTGGNILGMIRATEANLTRVTEKTIIIPGHGPVGNKSHLAEYRDMLVTIHDRVATLKKQGRSLDEVVAAKPTAAYDSKWGGFVITPDAFTGLVYSGV
ncbi:MAG TPA: MBL fold metallo-hydrolase [Chthonomonadaceae bacterium]|nr:MBL fold metallo-hydrolase [Chthonomonadaceae bacterium]